MVVTTATTGASSRNERSLSSASTTIYSLWPTRAFEPRMIHAAADDKRGIKAGSRENRRRPSK